jgi:DNA-binding phage protein
MDAKEFDYQSVGKKIRHILLDQDATITKLAEEMGISRQGLYWKITHDSWTVKDVYLVAGALNVDPKDLIGG